MHSQTSTILFTQSQPLSAHLLTRLKATLLNVHLEHVPFIELTTVKSKEKPDFSKVDVVLFVSKQAVRSCAELIGIQLLKDCRLISLGAKTAQLAETFFQQPCSCINGFESAEQFFKQYRFTDEFGSRWLVPISEQSQGKYVHLAQFVAPTIQLTEWIVYRNHLSFKRRAIIRHSFLKLPSNSALVFASPSAWHHLLASVGEKVVVEQIEQKQHRLFSIGSVTTQAIHETQRLPIYQAQQQTFASLIETIEEVILA